MGSFVVAVNTGNTALTHGAGGTGAGDLVGHGNVTCLTGEVLTTHVNVVGGSGAKEGRVQVPMLDGIPSASAEMATSAIGPGRAPHVLCDGEQVDSFLFLAACSGRLGI